MQIVSSEQKKLIERFGIFHEQRGMSPAVARILALLTIADRVELTFDEIREALDISKSAASNALNMLQKINTVEYITKPGDRKRYFRTKAHSWENDAESRFMRMFGGNEIMKEILKKRTHKTLIFNKGLERSIEFNDFILKEMMMALKKWKALKK